MTEYKPGEYQCIELVQLQSFTCKGWVLVALVTTQEPVWIQEKVPPAQPAPSGYQNYLETRQAQQLGTVVKALVMRNEDSVIAQTRAELYSVQRHADKLAERVAEVVKAEAALTKERDEARVSAKTEGDAYRKALASLDQQADLRRKLESDIAKIRTEIGAARMKEILGR